MDLLAVIFSVVALIAFGAIGFQAAACTSRWLANYTPRRVSLDSENDTNSEIPRPGVRSWYEIWKRTLRLEGWSSAFRRTMVPIALLGIMYSTFVSLVSHITFSSTSNPVWRRTLRKFVFSVLLRFFQLPLIILYARAATTPFKLPWLKPGVALRLLLTEPELRQPWIIILTPGLLVATLCSQLVDSAYNSAFLWSLNGRISRISLQENKFLVQLFAVLQEAFLIEPSVVRAWVLVNLVYCVIDSPLVIIITRLSVQKNYRRNDAVNAGEGIVDPSMVVYASPEEDVIRLRDDDYSPYLGFIDCAKKIINEEGWGTLYRYWVLSALSAFSGNVFLTAHKPLPQHF